MGRDLKPANIMIERAPDGSLHPVVMDFGLAHDSGDESGLTEAGAVLGTPAYMAPEQARGESRFVDRRCDVYSLGATLYDLIAGAPPHFGDNVLDVLLQVVTEEAKPLRLRAPAVPPDVETIVMKCLSKEPNQRYDSAKALAEDLGRYLNGDPIVGQKVSRYRRLRMWARKQRTLVALAAASLAVILALSGVFTRQYFVAKRERQRAAEQARLGQALAQEIKDMEWLLRSARQLSLHDLGKEKRIVRERIAELQADLAGYGELGRGLAHYAIGRGHMALQEYPEALTHLQQAADLGYESAEADYALGFVLGKHFEQALHDARRSGGGEWAKKQLSEIAPKYLYPAIAALQRSRRLRSGAHGYLDGLIAFYRRDYDAALKQADAAFARAPWLYEARKLAGDVHLDRALAERDGGRYQEAEAEFASAVRCYSEAAAVGHSDAQVYEGLAEAWVRQIEMNAERGQPTASAYAEAIAASDKLLTAEPDSVAGLLKKAYAEQLAMTVTDAGLSSGARVQRCLTAARAVLERQPDNPYAADLLAACHVSAAEEAQAQGRDPAPILRGGLALLEPVIGRHPDFLWGINDLAVIYSMLGDHLALQGDPTARQMQDKALEYYSLAQKTDPGYLKSYSNALCSYTSIIKITSSLAEIASLLKSADTVFSRCQEINARFASCPNNYAILYAVAARRASAPAEIRQRLDRAFENLALSRKLGANYLDTEQHTALAHLLSAQELLRAGGDPDPALQQAAAALARCAAISSDDPVCATLAVQEQWARADWSASQRRPALVPLERALALAEQATARAAAHPDVWQAVAETRLRLALATASAGRRWQHVEAGLAALDRVFAINLNHPPGLATRGALLLLDTARIPEPSRRRTAARAAQAALERAVQLDPAAAAVHAEFLARARALSPQNALAR